MIHLEAVSLIKPGSREAPALIRLDLPAWWGGGAVSMGGAEGGCSFCNRSLFPVIG